MCLEFGFRKYFSQNRWTNAICMSRNTLWKPTRCSTHAKTCQLSSKTHAVLMQNHLTRLWLESLWIFSLQSLPKPALNFSLVRKTKCRWVLHSLGMDIFHRSQNHFSQSNVSLKNKLPHQSHQWKEFCRIYLGKIKQKKPQRMVTPSNRIQTF